MSVFFTHEERIRTSLRKVPQKVHLKKCIHKYRGTKAYKEKKLQLSLKQNSPSRQTVFCLMQN